MIEGPIALSQKVDPSLLKLVSRSHQWYSELVTGQQPSLAAIGQHEGLTASFVGRVLPLAFLSPEIVAAILNGDHPPELTADTLVKRVELPSGWDEQRLILGFG